MRANSKSYIQNNFPDLLQYKRTTSRMYENKDKSNYYDNWWFKFNLNDLGNDDYIVFAGALDYNNEDFRIYKVPVDFIKNNLQHLYNKEGFIVLYITIESSIDIRTKNKISFSAFRLN